MDHYVDSDKLVDLEQHRMCSVGTESPSCCAEYCWLECQAIT